MLYDCVHCDVVLIHTNAYNSSNFITLAKDLPARDADTKTPLDPGGALEGRLEYPDVREIALR